MAPKGSLLMTKRRSTQPDRVAAHSAAISQARRVVRAMSLPIVEERARLIAGGAECVKPGTRVGRRQSRLSESPFAPRKVGALPLSRSERRPCERRPVRGTATSGTRLKGGHLLKAGLAL